MCAVYCAYCDGEINSTGFAINLNGDYMHTDCYDDYVNDLADMFDPSGGDDPECDPLGDWPESETYQYDDDYSYSVREE